MTDDEIEAEIRAKGLTAERVTPELIDSLIVGEKFTRINETLTHCALTLRNGYTVTGESACVSPENFDQGIGEHIARHHAREKIWMLEGYLLCQRLFTKIAP